jgi:hypothetical protein
VEIGVGDEVLIERPEDDDYDLLTYGEVAARLSGVLADERQRLADLLADNASDGVAVAAQEARIAELLASRERYEHQAATAEMFMKRFGLTPRPRD